MLSRRHIRLKVMQSLYAYFLSKEDNIPIAEKSMLKHIESVAELNLVIIALLVELVKHADVFFEGSKKKYFPTEADLNPKRRFVDNKVISFIKGNSSLMDKVVKVSNIWLKNDYDIVRKIFKELFHSELYKNYMNHDDESIEVDQRFIVNALNEYILNNKLVYDILEERSIYWPDDLPFVATILIGHIKSKSNMNSFKVFKDKSDKKFSLQLFRNTIYNNEEYNQIIIKFSENWDLDRIATMDQLIIKMAFTEILTMEELPVKVSMNEYIEIAKYYSTSKSKLFVNGLLDNMIKTFLKSGKIKKVGRGLV